MAAKSSLKISLSSISIYLPCPSNLIEISAALCNLTDPLQQRHVTGATERLERRDKRLPARREFSSLLAVSINCFGVMVGVSEAL